MTAPTVGIVSIGEMGQAVGSLLKRHGARVVTSLNGRSKRTVGLAAQADIEDVGGYEQLTGTVDIFISILEPAHALDVAKEMAAAMRSTGATPPYVDANAVSPTTMGEIAKTVGAAGAEVVDASIIGMPPKTTEMARFYASGGALDRFLELRGFGLDVRSLGDDIGEASAMKMAFAAITKGFTAVATASLITAHHYGVSDAVLDELSSFQPQLFERAEFFVPQMPPKARRWVGEMEEIADTYDSIGLTPDLFRAIADIYRMVGTTDLASETPEERDPTRTLDDVIATLSRVTNSGSPGNGAGQ